MSENRDKNPPKNELLGFMQTQFAEIFLKINIDNHVLNNYLNANKGDYCLLNSIHYSEGKFIINGFVLLNILMMNHLGYKIKQTKEEFKIFELDFSNLPDNDYPHKYVDDIFEFYTCQNGKLGRKLNITSIVLIEELSFFFKKFSKYFTEIVR